MGKDLNGKELGRGISQRKDGRYVARVQVEGEKVCIYGTDIELLKVELENRKIHIMEKQELVDENPTLDSYFTRWFNLYKLPNLKESSIPVLLNRYERTFGKRIGYRKLRDLSRNIIQGEVNAMMEEGNIPYSAVSESLSMLQSCFEHAKYEEIIRKNPCFDIVLRKPHGESKSRRFLNKEEIEIFLKAAEGSFYYEVLYIMIYSGLRIGEVGALQWENIDFDRECINVKKSLMSQYYGGHKVLKITSPKTVNSVRKIPFFKGVKKAFLSQKEKQNEAKLKFGADRWRCNSELGDPVFTTSMGSPVTRYVLSREINKIVAEINLKREIYAKLKKENPEHFAAVNPHALRHTFCSICFHQELDVSYTQRIMGHKNLTTTHDIYTHFMGDATKEIEKFNEVELPDYRD